MGAGQKLFLWVFNPHPDWEQNRTDKAFRTAGGDIYNQSADLSDGDCFKMLCDCPNMPVVFKFSRINNWPSAFDKIVEMPFTLNFDYQ